jgi:hypothetical protein
MWLYLVVDEIAEQFLSLVDGFNEGIDNLEDLVETGTAVAVRERISVLRHAILSVRGVLEPTRDAARAVLDNRVELDHDELFPREIEIHFADTYDKLLRASDGLDLSRDLLAGVRDYHQAQIANNQNEVMKRLTVSGGAARPHIHRWPVRHEHQGRAGIPLPVRVRLCLDADRCHDHRSTRLFPTQKVVLRNCAGGGLLECSSHSRVEPREGNLATWRRP